MHPELAQKSKPINSIADCYNVSMSKHPSISKHSSGLKPENGSREYDCHDYSQDIVLVYNIWEIDRHIYVYISNTNANLICTLTQKDLDRTPWWLPNKGLR